MLAITKIATAFRLWQLNLSNYKQLMSQHSLSFQKEDPRQRPQESWLKLTEQRTI